MVVSHTGKINEIEVVNGWARLDGWEARYCRGTVAEIRRVGGPSIEMICPSYVLLFPHGVRDLVDGTSCTLAEAETLRKIVGWMLRSYREWQEWERC